jgi:2-C-methyl-D-erythritol 4-phosphate cytidylyltransferase
LKKFVIIVAGGTGTRMGSDVPKQFLLLAGEPLLMHTIRAFQQACPDAAVIVPLPADQITRWEELQKGHGFDVPHQVVAGGATRFHSVKNALSVLPADGIVAIHDGARPLVSSGLIRKAFAEAEAAGNAVPAVAVSESMRETKEGRNIPVDRSVYRLIQTPQVFLLSDAIPAYQQEYRPEFTDDATVMESAGYAIHLIEGETGNIKITCPEDMVIAQALMTRPFQR